MTLVHPMINRCAVLIRPREPFFDWLTRIPEPLDLSPRSYNHDATVYLLPDLERLDDADELVERYWAPLFEHILSTWWSSEEDWPQERSREMFDAWFHCDFHSLVLDMVDNQPLTVQ